MAGAPRHRCGALSLCFTAGTESLGETGLHQSDQAVNGGLLIGTIGMTPTGEWRATFGAIYLAEGVQVVPAIIGFFAMSEVFGMVGKEFIVNRDVQTKTSVKKIIKGMGMALKYPKTILTCGVAVMAIGAIPAAGGTVAAFTAYGMTNHFYYLIRC